MKLLLAFALLSATSIGTAGTPPPTPPGPPTGSPKVCKQEGAPLLSLRHLGDPLLMPPAKDKQPPPITGSFVIWPTGAFASFDQDLATGKLSNERSGCIDDADFTSAKAAIAKATWQFSKAKIRCMARSLNHTDWMANDKVLWDEQTCGGDVPDEATKKAIDVVQALETKLTKSGPTMGRGKPTK